VHYFSTAASTRRRYPVVSIAARAPPPLFQPPTPLSLPERLCSRRTERTQYLGSRHRRAAGLRIHALRLACGAHSHPPPVVAGRTPPLPPPCRVTRASSANLPPWDTSQAWVVGEGAATRHNSPIRTVFSNSLLASAVDALHEVRQLTDRISPSPSCRPPRNTARHAVQQVLQRGPILALPETRSRKPRVFFAPRPCPAQSAFLLPHKIRYQGHACLGPSTEPRPAFHLLPLQSFQLFRLVHLAVETVLS